MRRAALLAVLGLLAAAPAASADRLILSEADATDLAEQLGEAQQATGVCFGWQVQVVALDGSPGGIDGGSDGGVDVAPAAGCARSLVLDASVTYTSESSESEDSVFVSVRATGLPAGTSTQLSRLAGRDEGELLGDDDDKALYELVAALPLLAAQLDPALAGRLPEIETGGAPADAAVDDNGGNDFLRQHGGRLLLASGLGLAAAWLLASGIAERRRRRPVSPVPHRST